MYKAIKHGLGTTVINEVGTVQKDVTLYGLYRSDVNSMASSTVSDEIGILVRFLNYLEGQSIELFKVTEITLSNYRDKLSGDGLTNNSVNLYITVICRFYWWAQMDGRVKNMIGYRDISKGDQDFFIRVESPRESAHGALYRIPFLLRGEPSKPIKYPTVQEVAQLKDLYLEKTARGTKHAAVMDELVARDELMLAWLSEIGLRISELVNLRHDEIPQPNPKGPTKVTIKHGTKYGKEREVEAPKWLLDTTNQFINYHREDLDSKGSSPFLFPNLDSADKPISIQNIEDKMKGLGMGIKPHDLRRFALTRYAATLYRNERLLVESSLDGIKMDRLSLELKVKNQAGHNTIDTTIKSYLDQAQMLDYNDSQEIAVDTRIQDLERELSQLQDMKAQHEGLKTPV